MIVVRLSNLKSENDEITTLPLAEAAQLRPKGKRGTPGSQVTASRKVVQIQYDTGADKTLVDQRFLDEAAGYYKKKGRLTNTKIVFADGSVGVQDPELVELDLQLHCGKGCPVAALVMPSIQELPELSAEAPTEWQNQVGSRINTGGRVDLLIGMDNMHLQPCRIPDPGYTIGRMTLSTSSITSNYLPAGGISSSKIISERAAGGENVTIKRTLVDASVVDLDRQLQQKWACENSAPLAMSKSSKSDHEQLVADHENELNYAGMKYDSENKRWVSTYIYSENLLARLSDNYQRVQRRMDAWYRGLVKSPEIYKAIQNQISDYVAKGFWVALEESDVTSDMKSHYLPFNYVYNENSESTPVRIVTDSSCMDVNGISLNRCQAGGSKFVGDTKATLLLTRAQQRIAVGDVSKFYHQYLLSGTDQSLRRLLVPKNFEKLDEGYDCFVEKMMPFGDAAAGPLAVLGRMKNCEMHIGLIPEELRDDVRRAFGPAAYVDDVVVSTTWQKDIEPVIEAAAKVAAAGSFTFKEWTKVGDDAVVKILGYLWDAKNDTLTPRLAFNAGATVRGKHLMPALTKENVEEHFAQPLTRRKVLALQGQFYDPLGFYLPMEMVLRHLHRQVCQEQDKPDFDAPINPEIQLRLKEVVLEALELRQHGVDRCVVDKDDPSTATGYIVACCDGSLVGHGVVLYWRPGELDQPSTPRMLQASARCAGLDGLTIYKNELAGAEKAVVEAEYTKRVLSGVLNILGICYISDSRAVLCALQHHGGKFKPFVSNRVSYIKANSDPTKWRHIPGVDNPADVVTRSHGTLADCLGDVWRKGGVLQQPITEVTTLVKKEAMKFEELPGAIIKLSSEQLAEKQVVIKRVACIKSATTCKIEDLDDPNCNLFFKLATCYNSWRMLVRVGARLLKWKYRAAKQHYSYGELMQRAESNLLRQVADQQPAGGKEVCGMQVSVQRGIKVVETRWVSAGRKRFLPILHSSSSFGQLILRDYHNSMAHFMSTKKVLERVRHHYLIPGAKHYMEELKKNCGFCKKLNVEAIQPSMGPVPHQRLLRKRPFSHVIADIFGPYTAVGVNKRSQQKVWALLIMCQSSRAINIVGMYDYSANAAICAISRHVCRYGQFVSWRSDSGTQLKAAGAAILQAIDPDGSEQDLLDLEAPIRTRWPDVQFEYGVPSAPWTQGSAEALIKLAKKAMKSLQVKEGERQLNLLQWESQFAKVAYLVNQRPLVSSPEPGAAICPNDVLHGYSGVAPELLAFPGTDGRRTPSQNLYDFWQRFIMETNTIAPGKWKKDKGEIKIGDTVLILDKPNAVGSYALGVVEELHPGADGKVRKVGLRTAKKHGNGLLYRHPRCLSKMLAANDK